MPLTKICLKTYVETRISCDDHHGSTLIRIYCPYCDTQAFAITTEEPTPDVMAERLAMALEDLVKHLRDDHT